MISLQLAALLTLHQRFQNLGVVLVEDVEHSPRGAGAVIALFILLERAVDRLYDVLDDGRILVWPLAPVRGLEDRAFFSGRVSLVERVPIACAERLALHRAVDRRAFEEDEERSCCSGRAKYPSAI